MSTACQLDLFAPGRRRFTGDEAEIDWDSASGMDLAANPRLLDRWVHSPERRREEAQMRRWDRNRRDRREMASAA